MAVIGTFGSFTAARLGIYASQSSLNVTGNNIANINTKGYTRQRMDLVSLHSGGNSRYYSGYNLDIGYGVLTDGVSQLRDPFLDIRYRNEQSSVGAYESKLNSLQQMSSILDEVGKGNDEFGVLAAQFEDFEKELNNLLGKVGSTEYDTTVRSSAEILTNLFKKYSTSLDQVQENQLARLKGDVEKVNKLLTQIRDLSEEIREAGIHGDKALELRDQRNVFIDELSSYMKIDVRYDKEQIDEFNSVERINISIADSGNPPIKLIQGVYGTQIKMPEKAPMRNPAFDASKPECNKYISRESDPVNGKWVYTNSLREALYAGTPPKAVTNDAAGAAALGQTIPVATYYNETANGPYLMKNPAYPADPTAPEYIGTEDPDKAEQIDNAVAKSDENRLWMSLEPLKDAKDRLMKDQNGREITESVDLTDTQLYGSLQALREFLTEKGEFSSEEDRMFDPNATSKRGVLYYKTSLDALARKFAEEFNNANRLNFDQVSKAYETNNNGDFLDKDGAPLTITDKNGKTVNAKYFDDLATKIKESSDPDMKPPVTPPSEEEIQAAYDAMEELRKQGVLTEAYKFYNGGVMFSNNGDTNNTDNIDASNITIAKSWSTGEVRILNTKVVDDEDHSTANDNVYHMINLLKKKMDYCPNEIVDDAADGANRYFNGTFAERLADINVILAKDQESTITQYNSYSVELLSLENSRQSVCGVDLNDEATNMMMFQKSYAAACQLMTTLDSMLDKLINGTI